MASTERVVLRKLTIREVICPICREIFIEPVSLPCKHIVCLQCLEQTVENNTLKCPICRTWIGTYLRLAKNRSKIINHKLWDQLKTEFPNEIQRKRNGEEDGISNQYLEDQPKPSITAERGVIKKEFDELLNKLRIEEEKCRRAEEAASEKLAQQLMWEPDDMQADSTSNDDDMDVENGRDSISIEMSHFRPICKVPKTPPKRLPNGQLRDPKILKPKNLTRSLDRRRATRSGLSLQNKASLKVSSNNFLSIPAVSTTTGPADTTTADDASPSGDDETCDLVTEHRRLEQKLLQEKTDYTLAVRLQRRWGRTPVKRQHTYSLRSTKRSREDPPASS